MIRYLLILLCLSGVAWATPPAPSNPNHPGSKSYVYGVKRIDLTCSDRKVVVLLPTGLKSAKVPAVVYGHGQALDFENYQGTLEHLAKKGVATIFPMYDSGFFDRDWWRMARDYINQTKCAIAGSGGIIASEMLIFSGHSKGAYVASIAAGLASLEDFGIKPRSILLFAPAGWEERATKAVPSSTNTSVIFSDKDTVVSEDISRNIYMTSQSRIRQLIVVKSYDSQVKADHFWPLTKGSFFGGGTESSLHYYGSWKWLVAAAQDLIDSGASTNPYIYGNLVGDKGDGTFDTVFRP